MFSIHCSECNQNHLLDTPAIESFANTDRGPIAIVRCLKGHEVVTDFGRRAAAA